MLKVVLSLHLQAWLLLTESKALRCLLTLITRFSVARRRGKEKTRPCGKETHAGKQWEGHLTLEHTETFRALLPSRIFKRKWKAWLFRVHKCKAVVVERWDFWILWAALLFLKDAYRPSRKCKCLSKRRVEEREREIVSTGYSRSWSLSAVSLIQTQRNILHSCLLQMTEPSLYAFTEWYHIENPCKLDLDSEEIV